MKQKPKLLSGGLTHRFIRVIPLAWNGMETTTWSGGGCHELVYVNSKGNIYADCDFSYVSQDQISHISILQDKSFDELAKEYAQAL